jgi:hypothetical protein
VLAGSGAAPANTSDPDYDGVAGRGGTGGADGDPGLVVVHWD